MPSSFRSIIEILLPGDLGSGLADFLLWPLPLYNIPLILGIPFAYGLYLMFKANKAWTIVICALLYLGSIYTQSNSKYHYNLSPYTVPKDQEDMNEGPSAPSDYTKDGQVWQDDFARLNGNGIGWAVIHLNSTPTPGQVTQEEAYWRNWFRAEVNYLILTNAMSTSEFNGIAPSIKEYIDSRTARYQAVAAWHNGGFADRWKYRATIDKMNSEDTPLTVYIKGRDAEQSQVSWQFWGPITFCVIGFLIVGFGGKYLLKGMAAINAARYTRSWGALFSAYTHAQAPGVRGPIKLRYPNMYINDTPYSLEDAWLDKDDHTLLILKNGTQVRLFIGDTKPNTYQDPAPPRKPKFTWDYVAQGEKKPVGSTARRSIFDQ